MGAYPNFILVLKTKKNTGPKMSLLIGFAVSLIVYVIVLEYRNHNY